MYILAKIIQCFFPLIALMLLIIGIRKNAINYVVSSLWLSLITVLIHFQFSGNQIFGSYFDYTNATIYSFNLLVLLVALIRVIHHLCAGTAIYKFTSSFISALLVVGAFLVMANLWINAFFINDVKPGTPMMQVALFTKPDYCNYQYVFYKIASDDSVKYLCPNHYGLIASLGGVSKIPDVIATQLHLSTHEVTQKK